MNGEPALPVDVEVGRHGALSVVAKADGSVVLREDLGRGSPFGGRVSRLHPVKDVDQLVRDLITARQVTETRDPATYREALP